MALVINDSELTRLWLSLCYAIISGIAYSLVGYFKRKESPQNTDPFSGEQFFISVIIGILGGFVAFWYNITPEQAVVLILSESALLYYIENILKAIWRRLIQPWLESLKTSNPPA